MGHLDIVLPGNLRISNRMVQAGDRVKAGDEVLTLDLDYVRAATEQLENEIDILNLKIGNLSNEVPSADTKMLQLAENNLRYAQADYVQLVAALEASGIQVEQDLKEAQNRYHQELNDLEKAKVQAKEEGIETAENGLDARFRNALVAVAKLPFTAAAAASCLTGKGRQRLVTGGMGCEGHGSQGVEACLPKWHNRKIGRASCRERV